jgi:AraC-like DNA-binding protein/tetratricopeptide (TPR) repeat protein
MVRRPAASLQFREAAQPTFERIRRDRERVSERAAPLLALIEERLFDVDLDLRLRKRLELLPDDVVREFYDALGLRPREYVRERRLDVANLLLRTTRWPVWQVAAEVGFLNTKQLQYAFKTRTGSAPSTVRPEPSETEAAKARTSDRAPEHSVRLEVQGAVGMLDSQATVALVQRLRALVPSVKRREPSRPVLELSMPGYRRERELAATLWKTAGDLPTRHLRHVLCRRLRFESPALFRLLGEKGREIGRRDRKRGVDVVGLGVEVLEANAEALGESVHDLLTVGWSWTANQRRLHLDWPGSEEAFGFAREEWETPRASPDPLAEAEYCNLLASFRFHQGRLNQARQLSERAIDLLRVLGDKDLLVRVLSLRTDIAQADSNPRESIPYLVEALKIVDDNENPYLAGTLSTQLTMAYILAGETSNASDALGQAKALWRPDFSKLCANQLVWLEGLICHRQGRYQLAEQHLQESRAGLAEEGEMGHFAFVTLALAELYVEESNAKSALKLISEIIPILETFAVHRGVLTAIRLLRAAERDDTISLELLAEINKCLTPIQGRLLARRSAE